MSRIAFVFPDVLRIFLRAPTSDLLEEGDRPRRLPRAPGWGDRRRARSAAAGR